MTDTPIDLAGERIKRTNDARDWSCADALRHVLGQIERGEIAPDMVYIAMGERDPKARRMAFLYCAAGGSNIETVGLLAQHLHCRSML